MEYYSGTFFCKPKKGPVVHIVESINRKDKWPITIVLNTSVEFAYTSPAVRFHIASKQDLINFKNSVIEAYETFVRRRKEVKE